MLELLQQQYADDPSGSITLAGTIIAQAHAEHDPGTRAYASLYLGLAQCFTAQYDSAMGSLVTAHTYFTEQADPAGIMLSLNALGGLYLESDHIDHALHCFFQLEDLALKKNDLDRLTAAYINLGILYSRTGMVAKAEIYLEKGAQAVSLTGNRQHLGTLHAARAICSHAAEEYDQALGHLDQAYHLLRELEQAMIPEILVHKSEILLAQKHYREAQEHAGEALLLAERLSLHRISIRTHYALGTIFNAAGDLHQAITCHRSSLQQARTCAITSCIIQNIRELIDLYSRIGDDHIAVGLVRELWELEDRDVSNYRAGIIEHTETLQRLKNAETERDLLTRRSKHLEANYRTMHELSELMHDIVSIVDFDLALDTIGQRIGTLITADTFSIFSIDHTSGMLIPRYALREGRQIEPETIVIEEICTRCARDGKLIHTGREPEKAIPGTRSRPMSTLCVPLVSRGETIGVCSLQAFGTHAYTAHDRDIVVTLCGFIAVSMANHHINEELRTKNTNLLEQQMTLKQTLNDLHAAHDRIETLAMYDGLTGLPNRYLLERRLDEILHLASRNSSLFGICFIDLDNFKALNDTYGHAAGDRALSACADRITGVVRKSDLVARYGGDEFIGVFSDIKSPEDLKLIADKIIRELLTPFDCDDRAFSLGASIGISIYPEDGLSPEVLIQQADTALYQAKARGKGCVQFYRT
jgi:diguanylate cyclase (GGDEF)-like protein